MAAASAMMEAGEAEARHHYHQKNHTAETTLAMKMKTAQRVLMIAELALLNAQKTLTAGMGTRAQQTSAKKERAST